MNEISTTKIYTITVVKKNGNSETWTFLNYVDRDEFLDYLDELQNECEFDIQEDEYWVTSLESDKQQVDAFLGIDNEDEVDDTDKRTCERWPNGLEDVLEDDDLRDKPLDDRGDYND